MKNKLSILLLVMTFICSAALLATTTETANGGANTNLEMSENQLKGIQEECSEIGIDSDMQGEELTAFVTECVDVGRLNLHPLAE